MLHKNFFEIFGLPVTFQVDKVALAQRYRDLQRVIHPDNYANATDADRRLALQQTAHINQAFETLKNPLIRAQYLLELQGIDMKNDSSTMQDETFLMAQIEWREAIAEARQSPTALNQLAIRLEKIIAPLIEQLTHYFDVKDYTAAHLLVYKLKFFERLREEILNLSES